MRLPFDRAAWPFVLPPALLGLLALPWGGSWTWAGIVLLALSLAVLLFFRDPQRTASGGEDVLLSPADGRVVRAGPLQPGDDPPEGAEWIVSIFLSILDVHVNRAPASGTIDAVEYTAGSFRAAFRPEASLANERNEIRQSSPHGPVVFRQIAGLVARRIVCRCAPGDRVRQGQRVGLIRFGSRVDLFGGAGWEITAEVGTKVRGGASVLARWSTDQIRREPAEEEEDGKAG